ncbi:ABC transporter [Candidatus Syntrophocurvum alkaliphilum]|uniref:ABC transporter n=1 Tax=Candidatus Syntrophocurvum alkaliphilum TaxID=2293317 RepID=A0A6I6DCU8_9FIRM|nr:ABC transporter ATP-binding protein [Candidatus Syntrophocurvum alkaliphilum]QGT99115.1 ABC transporter [Candidatus Syntrophocurvum alkaliphilum]
MGTSLTIDNLSVSFANLEVIDNWNFTISNSERIVLLGPSGAGKTTFLRVITGLEKPSSGTINITTKKIAMVFQEPRLIPWRTVKDNLLFVNNNSDPTEILKRLQLSEFEDYFPHQLSGGMQQRVNLARALMIDPDILILDEAFSSLDWAVKIHIMKDMLSQWNQRKFTCISVTHDLKEALYIADRIIIISPRPSSIIHDIKVELSENERSFTSTKLLELEAKLLNIITNL